MQIDIMSFTRRGIELSAKSTGMSVFVWERVRSVSVYKVWQISGNIRCRDTD